MNGNYDGLKQGSIDSVAKLLITPFNVSFLYECPILAFHCNK